MKIVTINMELVIDDDIDMNDHEKIANYLTGKLYTDPEFFDGFGPENIVSVVHVVE
jgi:hypothetical protein